MDALIDFISGLLDVLLRGWGNPASRGKPVERTATEQAEYEQVERDYEYDER